MNKHCMICKKDLNDYELNNCYIRDDVTYSELYLCSECYIKTVEDALKIFDTDIKQL